MDVIKQYIIIDKKPSRDFNVYISGGGTYTSPGKLFEEVNVPGRNGSIFLYEGAYKNVDISYKGFIGKVDGEDEVELYYKTFRSFLMSRNGYVRIEDTYHPDEIIFGTYNDDIKPKVHSTLQAVEFELKFSCKPQRFIKKYYDTAIEYTTSGSTFYNDTFFDAKPLIRAYGTGWFQINDVKITINSANSYTDFDCDLQEAYKDTFATNCNGNITITNALFPYLAPGLNTITFSGITKIELYPRLFTL